MPYELAQDADIGRDRDTDEDQGARELESSVEEQDQLDEVDAGPNEALEGDDADEDVEMETAADQADTEDKGDEQSYLLEVDGEKWTHDQVREGVLRQADYTRKTQALAEQRREAEAQTERELQEARMARDQYADRLQQLSQVMGVETEPDWDELAQSDPAEFQRQFAAWQKRSSQRQKLQGELERVTKERQADFQKQYQSALQRENVKLLEVFPDWSEPDKRETAQTALRHYALGAGFADNEIDNVADHRLLVLLDKARRYDELQTRGKDLLAGKEPRVKVLEPGTRKAGPSSKLKSEIRALRSRAQRSGSYEDAVALLQAERRLASK